MTNAFADVGGGLQLILVTGALLGVVGLAGGLYSYFSKARNTVGDAAVMLICLAFVVLPIAQSMVFEGFGLKMEFKRLQEQISDLQNSLTTASLQIKTVNDAVAIYNNNVIEQLASIERTAEKVSVLAETQIRTLSSVSENVASADSLARENMKAISGIREDFVKNAIRLIARETRDRELSGRSEQLPTRTIVVPPIVSPTTSAPNAQ